MCFLVLFASAGGGEGRVGDIQLFMLYRCVVFFFSPSTFVRLPVAVAFNAARAHIKKCHFYTRGFFSPSWNEIEALTDAPILYITSRFIVQGYCPHNFFKRTYCRHSGRRENKRERDAHWLHLTRTTESKVLMGCWMDWGPAALVVVGSRHKDGFSAPTRLRCSPARSTSCGPRLSLGASGILGVPPASPEFLQGFCAPLKPFVLSSLFAVFYIFYQRTENFALYFRLLLCHESQMTSHQQPVVVRVTLCGCAFSFCWAAVVASVLTKSRRMDWEELNSDVLGCDPVSSTVNTHDHQDGWIPDDRGHYFKQSIQKMDVVCRCFFITKNLVLKNIMIKTEIQYLWNHGVPKWKKISELFCTKQNAQRAMCAFIVRLASCLLACCSDGCTYIWWSSTFLSGQEVKQRHHWPITRGGERFWSTTKHTARN